jgi:5-methylcytosine-specific restriction endonuclease McrA
MQAQEVQPEFEVVEEIPDQSYQSFLASKEWALIRRRVLERDRGLCQACLRRPGNIVHHLTMRYGFRPPMWCLRTVCRPCHARFAKRFAGNNHRARRDDWLGKNGRS